MQTVAAIYARLSKEDESKKGVSKSIENQISSLKKYAKEHGILIYDIYYDDGVSGSTVERTGFQTMLKDMKNKKFNGLLLKDLSRLTRDYLVAGEYIENIFPSNNIRVISVADNYDSDNKEEDDTIILKSIVNDYYLKECRKKARLAANKRATSGYYNNGGVYGYMKDGNKKIIKDPHASVIVKNIFKDFLDNIKISEIAKKLKIENIPTPSYQTFLNTNKRRYRTKSDNNYNWVYNTVHNILTNIEYTGTAVNKSTKYVDNKQVKNDKPIFIEDALPSIITKEDYNLVQEKIKSTHSHYNRDKDDVRLKGLIRCSDCNSSMIYTNNKITNVYLCKKCGKRIKSNIIHDILYKESFKLVKTYLNNNEEFKHKVLKSMHPQLDFKNIKTAQNKKLRLENKVTKLFEDKIDAKITNDNYLIAIKPIKKEIESIESQLSKFNEVKVDEKLIDLKLKEFSDVIKELNFNDKLEFIRKVVVVANINNNYKIQIKYKFDI